MRKKLFIIGRVGFGLLYLGAAIFNWVMAIASPDTYRSFADHAYVGFYSEAWDKIVDPHLVPWIVILGFIEFGIAMLFFTRREYVRIGLGFGIIFTLVLAPFGEWTLLNLVLVMLQMLLLAYDLRAPKSGLRIVQNG